MQRSSAERNRILLNKAPSFLTPTMENDDWGMYEELAIQNIHEALNACLNLASIREDTINRLKDGGKEKQEEMHGQMKAREAEFQQRENEFENKEARLLEQRNEFHIKEASLESRIRKLEDELQSLQDVNHFLEGQLNEKVENAAAANVGKVDSQQLEESQKEVAELKDVVKELTEKLNSAEKVVEKMEKENEFWSHELKNMTERKDKLEKQLDMWRSEMGRNNVDDFMDHDEPKRKFSSFDIPDDPEPDQSQAKAADYVTPGNQNREHIEIESIAQIEQFCRIPTCPPDYFQMFREALAVFIQTQSPQDNARIFALLLKCTFGRSNQNQQLKLAGLLGIVRSISLEEVSKNWTLGLIKRLLGRIFDTTEFGLLRDNQIESYVQMTQEIFHEVPEQSWYLKVLVDRIISRKNTSIDKLLAYIDELIMNITTSARFRESLIRYYDRYTHKLISNLEKMISQKGDSRASKQMAQSLYIKVAAVLNRKDLLKSLPYWRNEKMKYESQYELALQSIQMLS